MATKRTKTDQLPKSIKLMHALIPAWDSTIRSEPESLTHNFNREQFPSGERLIGLVSHDASTYSTLAVLKKSSNTSTFQRRLRFERMEPIGPIKFGDIQRLLPPRLQSHFVGRTENDLSAFPHATADAIAVALAGLDKNFSRLLTQMVKEVDRRPIPLSNRTTAWRIMAWEKEALDTALILGGLKHTTLTDDQWQTLREPSPILDLLGGANVLEDRQIEMDAVAFGGLRLLNADLRGRVFLDPEAGSRVTVINANRGPLERTLGVDLVIYYQRFASYLLVQYKRLIREEGAIGGSQWRFRPSSDRNFAREVRRMMAIRQSVLSLPIQSPTDYRLSDDPFYFKFCRNDSFECDSSGMTPGLHILAVDAEHFLKSTHSKGPKGGAYLGFDNLLRRLPNTLFLELARQGWIGSRALGSEKILNVVTSSLSASRSVMMASIVGRPVAEIAEPGPE